MWLAAEFWLPSIAGTSIVNLMLFYLQEFSVRVIV